MILVIGVAQFPSSIHPNIDPEVIKGYVLGFASRPVTAFPAGWAAQLRCLRRAADAEERAGGGSRSGQAQARHGRDREAARRPVLGRRDAGDGG